MRIYTPEATKRWLKPAPDGCGYMLEYEGQTTGLVQPPPSWGPLDVQDVLRAIADLNERFPLGWLGDFPVFITDLQYMYYDGRTWSDTGTVAKTYPQYVILCAQADHDEPKAAMTITHELGHVMMLKLMDTLFDGKETPRLAEYRQLRKLGPEIGYGWYWEDQIYEVLAEDFRWLFGSPIARLERFRTMDEAQDPKPPGEEVRRWFLSLLPANMPEFRIEIITGKEETSMATRVCLDPGHGGSDPGAVGPSGVREKDVTLAVALRTAEHLRRHGVEVQLTRDKDMDVSLGKRCQVCNDFGANLFVSIHCNSSTNRAANGMEVWTSRGQTAGDKLADFLARELRAAFPNLALRSDLTDGDLDKEADFQVLKYTRPPAALVELAFISNPSEEKLLASPDYQERAARAVAKGILVYLGVAWQEPKEEVAQVASKVVLTLKVGGKEIKRNDGKVFLLDVPAKVENGRTLVPLRAICEALGATVNYNAATQEITITL